MTTITEAYKTPGLRENSLSAKARRMALSKAGYETIGRGSRASAHVHPSKPQEVIRVAGYDGTAPEDNEEPRDGWLEYLKAFADRPNVHFPEVYEVKLYDGFYEAHMERLRKATEREFRAGMTPSTSAYVEEIQDAAWDRDVHMDIHEDNIMIRPSTGEQVVTDPWFMDGWVGAWA